MQRLSVVVVNWNAGVMLDRCLQGLAASEPWGGSCEVLLVDNASTDGSHTRAARAHPDLQLIENRENVGFARGVNAGLRRARGDLTLLLNPDVALSPPAIREMIEVMAERPDAAAVAPKLLNPDGSVQGSARRDPSAWTGLFGRSTLLTRLLPNNRLSRRELPCLTHRGDEPLAVDWVSGACLLVRTSVYRSVGLMDERFFLFWEDADWCRRFRLGGWRVLYLPRVTAEHAGGVSWAQRPYRSVVDFHRSAYWFYRKHYLRAAWHPLHVPVMGGLLLSLGLRLLRCLLQRIRSRRVLRGARRRSPPGPPPPEAAGGREGRAGGESCRIRSGS